MVSFPGISQVIIEHEKRKERFNVKYDPIKGIGSPLERFELVTGENESLLLPVSMKKEGIVQFLQEHGGYAGLAKHLKTSLEAVKELLFKRRIKHDYEYWCATCATIEDAETAQIFPMILNPPQLISLKDREEMRLSNKPIRQIELKHRQYGSSTEKNCYTFWLQNVVFDGLNAYLCSIDKSGASEILRRYEVISNNYPSHIETFKLRGYKGLSNTQIVEPTGAIVNIGSAENPNAPSGRTVQIVLISEAGKMSSTEAKGANKLITNMVSMVRMAPNTAIMIESTAEKSGAYFRRQVYKAQRGESAFKLTFISWLTDPRCQVPLDASEYISFIEAMSDYEKELWGMGASLDQINWYRNKLGEYDFEWEMQQENPAKVDEAFAGAGKKVFTPLHIVNCQKHNRKPDLIGSIKSKTGATTGADCLKELYFEPDPAGNLMIWTRPNDPPIDPDYNILNRYCGFVDIGGTTATSDWSIVSIGDRYWSTQGGGAERCAMWRGHVDPDQLAWISAQIAKWYNNAFLAVEVNSLYSRGNNTEGVHYLQIFQEIVEYYPYLFTRTDSDDIKEKNSKYGFHMNKQSKNQLIDAFRKGLREGGWVEYSDIVGTEISQFIHHEDGSQGAVEDEHDDALVGAMGVNWLANEYMPDVKLIKKTPKDVIERKKNIKSTAVI